MAMNAPIAPIASTVLGVTGTFGVFSETKDPASISPAQLSWTSRQRSDASVDGS